MDHHHSLQGRPFVLAEAVINTKLYPKEKLKAVAFPPAKPFTTTEHAGGAISVSQTSLIHFHRSESSFLHPTTPSQVGLAHNKANKERFKLTSLERKGSDIS
jgi:hypothetical protein